MDKEEMLKMAREARSWQYQDQRGDLEEGAFCFDEDSLQALTNAILERAAVACESQADRFMQGSPLEGNKPYASHECAASIRALKTKE